MAKILVFLSFLIFVCALVQVSDAENRKADARESFESLMAESYACEKILDDASQYIPSAEGVALKVQGEQALAKLMFYIGTIEYSPTKIYPFQLELYREDGPLTKEEKQTVKKLSGGKRIQ